MRIDIVIGNIVRQPDAQAIVNSANANLRLGSGVAGAIHTAAGPGLEAHCRPLAPLAAGKALLTPGFDLPNPWVIHLRASHYLLDPDAADHLASALDAAMAIANEHRITTLAMPAVGVGVFRFPIAVAASITAQALRRAVVAGTSLAWVRICTADSTLRDAYEQACRMDNAG